MNQINPEFKKKWEDIRNQYQEEQKMDNLSILLKGYEGSGKSTFITTGRLPILIDSFDPNGTILFKTDPVLKKLVDEGKIIIRTFWNESFKHPTEYSRWENQWEKDISTGFLKLFGTYAIDSGTKFLDALSNAIAKKKGRQERVLAMQDYQGLFAIVKDIIALSQAQDVDFIFTTHLVNDKDELTGEITTDIKAYKSLRVDIPILFTEKYTIIKKPSANGMQFKLLTIDEGRYRASTQLGASGKFLKHEEPNLKKLLAKAGLNTQDKDMSWMGGF